MNILAELKRRNVFRVTIAYMVISWIVLQVSDVVLEGIEAPVWVMKFMILLIIIGLLITVVISWAYELTPEGIKRDKDVKSDHSASQETIKKLDILILIALSAIAIMFAWNKFQPQSNPSNLLNKETSQSFKDTLQQEDKSAKETLSDKKDNSIAVLPFAHRSELKNDLYFTDGIHDDLLTQLAKIQKLNVTSRTSVMQYRNTDKSIKEIAAELNVGTILEGGIQRAGKRIRINAQLIDVATDEHLWAETFDREMTVDNLFDIQSEITKQIVTAVKGELTSEDELAISKAPTQSIQAYEFYLQAKKSLSISSDKEQFKKAEIAIKQAIELDPNFALAYLILADIYGYSFWFSYDLVEDPRQQVLKVLNKAESILSPSSGELLAAQGEFLYRFDNNYSAALNKMLQAAAIITSDARLKARIGHTQRRLGLFREAIDSYNISTQIDPNYINSYASAAQTIDNLQDWRTLDKYLKQALKRFPDNYSLLSFSALLSVRKSGNLDKSMELYNKIPPNSDLYYSLASLSLLLKQRDYPILLNYLQSEYAKNDEFMQVTGNLEFNIAKAYFESGQVQKAQKAFLNLINRLEPEIQRKRSAPNLRLMSINLALSYTYIGEKEKSIELIDSLLNQINDKFMSPTVIVNKCWILAYNGEIDEALSLLEKHLNKKVGVNRWDLYLNPRWDFFRTDERFNELIKPLNFDQSIHAK